MFDFEEDLNTRIKVLKVLGRDVKDAFEFTERYAENSHTGKVAINRAGWDWMKTAIQELTEELEK